MMHRTFLVERLTSVKPALSSSNLVPILQHFWFTGEEVLAYNDMIALSAPCQTEFTGAVSQTLIDLMRASRAKKVAFEDEGNFLLIKASKSRIKLGLLPEEDFIFEMPGHPKSVFSVSANDDFINGIASCLKSVSGDTSVPDQLGVTLLPVKDGVDLFSVNGATVSNVEVRQHKVSKALKKRVVLAAPFCEHMIRMVKAEGKGSLSLSGDYALFSTASDLKLFGKLIDVEKPLDFHGLIDDMVPEDLDDISVPMPKTMRLIIDRAVIIAESSVDGVHTKIVVSEADSRARFYSKSGKGEIRDSVELSGHEDVRIGVDPAWLKVGYVKGYDRILFLDGCVIMSKPGEIFLVASKAP